MIHLTLMKGIRLHPLIDIVGAAAVTAFWWIAGHSTFSFSDCSEKSPNDLFVGLSALSGLVMAVATFICTTVYQSDSHLMKEIRKRYSDELSKNWLSIISCTLVTAFLPLISLCIWDGRYLISFGLAVFSAVLLAEKSIRCVYWLRITFFMEAISNKIVRVDCE